MQEIETNIVEKIHNEFDSAQNKIEQSLLKILEESNISKSETRLPDDFETKMELEKLGFYNSKTFLEVENKKGVIDSYEYLSQKSQKTINQIRSFFSVGYKVIDYPSLYEILEKYNLLLGHSSLFIGHIPMKNIEDMKTYKKLMLKNEKFKYVKEKNIIKPIVHNVKTTRNFDDSSFYIVAPSVDFEKKDTMIIGQEIFNKPSDIKNNFPKISFRKPVLDPVVLKPLVDHNDNVWFHIVTKWGSESLIQEFN